MHKLLVVVVIIVVVVVVVVIVVVVWCLKIPIPLLLFFNKAMKY